MAVDLSAEVKRVKLADTLINGEDDSDSESEQSTDEPDSTDSTEETDSGKEDSTTAPETPSPPSRRDAGFLSFSDYSGAPAPAVSPTPTPSAADRIGPFTHAIAEDQPVADYVPAPATAQQGQPQAAPAPEGHIDLGPPGRNIYTASDTGARYVIDQSSGQMVPYAELATAADKTAQPPGGVDLPRAVVTGTEPAPDRLTQVERGELVGLPWHPIHPEQLEDRGERGVPITPVQRAQPVTYPTISDEAISPRALALPGERPAAQAPVTQQAPTQASARSAAGFLSFSDYSAPKPSAAQQPGPQQPPVTGDLAQGPPGTHPAGTQDEPYWPKRVEQIKQLPPGSVYVDPQDQSIKRTPGQPPAAAQPPVPQGGDTGVADYFAKRGDKPISSANDPRLTTVTVGDQNYRVNKEAAPYFQGFLNELAAKGAPVQAGDSWVYREKVGAKGLSDHAYGGAIDVNQGSLDRNKVSPAFQKWIDANPGVLQQIEKRWNIYGGERFGDLGHFEWGGAPFKQVAQQSAAGQPSAPGQAPVEPQIDIQSNGYSPGRGGYRPEFIIMHSTDGRTEQGDINTLAREGNVGVHYLTTRDGQSLHLVNEGDSAWQAGKDKYGNVANQWTIGIEQSHVDGQEKWSDDQVRASAQNVADIMRRNPWITLDHVLGHSDLAPERKQDPLNYPWDKFYGYVQDDLGLPHDKVSKVAYYEPEKGLPTDATTTYAPGAKADQVTAPSAQPITKLKNGFYQDEKPGDFLNGRVTSFATPDDIASGQDNGVGSPHLGRLDTTQVAGVALPQWVLQQYFGNSTAAMRQARVDVVDPQTGKRLRVPIVDVGPGPGPENAGVVADMTPALKDYFGGDKNLSIKIVPKAGPDVMKNPQLFYDEQAAIKNGFDSGSLQPNRQVIAPGGARFTSVAQTPEEATAAQQKVQQAIQTQKDLLTKLPEAQGDNPNLIGYYKRLDDPVDGVTPQMRQAMQAGLKTEIIAAMRDKFPDIKSDDEAWTKAQSNVGPLEVGAEAWSQLLGGFQQYTSVLQKGVAGTDQLHVNQFLDSALPGANDQQKNDYLAKLYAMPIDQRITEVQSHLPQPQTGIPSTDPQQIISALDRIHSTDYQKQQAADLATAAADMKRNLTTDPRLVGTGVGKIVDNVAQIPAFVAAYRNPVMLPLVLAQTNDMARTQLRADHPDWDEKTIGENAARATVVMFLGQEAGAKLMSAGGGALLSSLEGGGKRAIAQALVGLGGGTAIGAATQAGVNVATGQPIGRGVGEAAITGAIQGGVTGIVHGAGELIRPGERQAEVVPEVQPAPPAEPVAPSARPVTTAEVIGPEAAPSGPVTQEDVARRAYELFDERTRNEQPGTALDDWTQAQKELSQAKEPILPAPMSEAEPINSAIANRYVQERMAAGELGQIDPSQGQSTEDMVQQGLQMSRTQRDGLIDNFMKAKGGDLDQQGAAIRSKEALFSEQARAASRAASADPTNPQLQAQAKAAADAVTAFHNGPIKKFKQVWSDSGRVLQKEIPLDYTTFNGMKEAYLKGNNKEAPVGLEPKLKQMADAVSKNGDAERVAMNNWGKEIEKQTRGKTLPTDDQIRARLMEIMPDLPCRN